MKKLLAGIAVFCMALAHLSAAHADTSAIPIDPAKSGCIVVNIRNINKPEGMLGVALYSSKQGFPDKTNRAIATQVKKISGTSQDVRFDNIPYGAYAVSVLHDENGNGKMDKKAIFIPKEGFGVSNNPKIKRGPPSFSEAIFTLDRQRTELTVNMIYL
ncbi:MAG: DUF2141 domain-containing protein [Chlorobium sp.]|jgi:uncharacterized protein (DUF2141 family)|uniref:DUF2141 domain-containing protein n=1 Tax=Chlorobium sp. TaxID=1095 RepID=UPI001D902D5A|nr:DUF2141 domain-containing protein [Chlorobium sp.]MBN1278450.1 DUF2141 domain-containing protein [Chlorobiaceae bacterium]MCF8215848.1 DUF2141 domain-containing protein [Chlorobium sp.]MCF8270746.1 DUF2141 domain-containing protein [Chlorobium sp.]MCF8287058.1 DUF2141 domain-containing protein [Chlorobium sp.]MCF8290715.1 DUF2141 domain-containing protein [Chlorobium sp.]